MSESTYDQAHFQLDSPAVDLPAGFGIVTACNPMGVTVEASVNEGLDRDLGLSLLGQGVPHFRVTGGSRDMSHAEPGYGCVVHRERIVELGRQWNQEAVFWVEGDQLFLVSCDESKHEEALGSFRERLI
jgi:hypothetical protein